jgi:hypothetical protein
MEDWMGRIRPMPSEVKIAEPIVKVKSRGFKSFTVESKSCLSQGCDVVVVDICEADEDEGVCQKCGRTKLGNVPDESEWNEKDELSSYRILVETFSAPFCVSVNND